MVDENLKGLDRIEADHHGFGKPCMGAMNALISAWFKIPFIRRTGFQPVIGFPANSISASKDRLETCPTFEPCLNFKKPDE